MLERAIVAGRPDRGALIVFGPEGEGPALADALAALEAQWRVVVADRLDDSMSTEVAATAFAVGQLRRIPGGAAVLIGRGPQGSRLATGVAREIPMAALALVVDDASALAPSSDSGTGPALVTPEGVPARILPEGAGLAELVALLDELHPTPKLAHPFLADEIAALIAANPQAPVMTLEEARARGERMNPPMDPPEDCDLEVVELGGVESRIMGLAGREAGLIFFVLHGGGYVMGSSRFEDPRCADLVRSFSPLLGGGGERGVTSVVPEYGLAPEAPHPRGLEDSLAALRAVFVRYPGIPVVLYGDSAGSGMANQVLRSLAPAELSRIAGAVLLEPCLDPSFDSLSSWENREGPVWTRQLAVDSWRHYCQDRARPWDVHPLVAELPAEFPPVFVVVNPGDPLRDEAVDWAFDLARAGVRMELHSLPGTAHGWLAGLGTRTWEKVKLLMRDFLVDALEDDPRVSEDGARPLEDGARPLEDGVRAPGDDPRARAAER